MFEVDPYVCEANLGPQPVKAPGRFAHEAVVVDPRTGPGVLGLVQVPGDGAAAGPGPAAWAGGHRWDAGGDDSNRRLRRARGRLSRAAEVGTRYDVTWVTVPDRGARETSTRRQLVDDRLTRARKLEGAWWDDRGCYFVASDARSADSPDVRTTGMCGSTTRSPAPSS